MFHQFSHIVNNWNYIYTQVTDGLIYLVNSNNRPEAKIMLPFLDIVKTGLEDIVAETFWFLLKSIKGHIWFVKTFAQGIWERLLELSRFVYLSPDRYEIKAKGCDDWKTICGIFHKSIMHAIIILVHIYFFKFDFFFCSVLQCCWFFTIFFTTAYCNKVPDLHYVTMITQLM